MLILSSVFAEVVVDCGFCRQCNRDLIPIGKESKNIFLKNVYRVVFILEGFVKFMDLDFRLVVRSW